MVTGERFPRQAIRCQRVTATPRQVQQTAACMLNACPFLRLSHPGSQQGTIGCVSRGRIQHVVDEWRHVTQYVRPGAIAHSGEWLLFCRADTAGCAVVASDGRVSPLPGGPERRRREWHTDCMGGFTGRIALAPGADYLKQSYGHERRDASMTNMAKSISEMMESGALPATCASANGWVR
jgi:hypothetical protein